MPRTYPQLDVHSDQGGLFPFKSKRLDVGGGIQQAYIDEGPRDAELTFLLAHGNPTWSFLWRRFIMHLSVNHRVIAPDDVGFGRSDKPRDPTYYTLEGHIKNLETLMDHVGAKNVVVVAQDWGGPIAYGWATRHPERVSGCVVLNTWAMLKDPPLKLLWLFKKLVLGTGGWHRITQKNFFVETIIPRVGTNRKLSPKEMDAYRAPFPTPEDRIGIARFPQLIPETHDATHESRATMQAIEEGLEGLRKKPALIVWGLKDKAFRKAHLERWTRTFDDVDGPYKLANAIHYLQEDAPDEILKRIDLWVARAAKARRANA
jgi:pimeloyl-ACP methyl ester carboxylesterase